MTCTKRLFVTLVVFSMILAACGADEAVVGEAEVFLEPASATGPDPFTGSVASTVSSSPLPSPSASASPTPGTTSPGDIRSEVGTAPGLYGGSNQIGICDKAQLVAFLNENDAKRTAWAHTLGIDPDAVGTYVDDLAPVVLRSDTRVTNHGFADGNAIPRQSVLEAGTAVLVDDTGTPRVRCACGNPLLDPIPVTTGPTYVGDSWAGFKQSTLVVIVAGPPVIELVVVDIGTGAEVAVPVGQSPTPATTGAPPGAGASGSAYTDCARRYGELFRDLTLAGLIGTEQSSVWSASADLAADYAQAGNLDAALAECETTVDQMQAVLNGAG